MAENTKADETLGGLLIKANKQFAIKSPEYTSVYANNIHLAASVFDFSLTFGELTEEIREEQSVVNQKVRVILSKEMAKVLLALLANNISAYEKQFGEITLPQQPKETGDKGGIPVAGIRPKSD